MSYQDEFEQREARARSRLSQLQSTDPRAPRSPELVSDLAREYDDIFSALFMGNEPDARPLIVAQLGALSEVNPTNRDAARALARSLVPFLEHGGDRAAVEAKLRYLGNLAERFRGDESVLAPVTGSLGNVRASGWTRSNFPDLAEESARRIEAIAAQFPASKGMAQSLGQVLLDHIRDARTPAEREAAVARLRDLSQRFPDVDSIRVANNLATRSQSGGCYVATAVYGSYEAPPVLVLRRFRDASLARTALGRAFIRSYYATSPWLVTRFGHVMWLREAARWILDRLVRFLSRRVPQE